MRQGPSAGIIRAKGESFEQGGNPVSTFPVRILLATDGSEKAELAATTAADLAEKTNSELHVVTVGPDYKAVSIEPTRLAICDRLSRPQVLVS
jgi:hypothetical protein